MKPKPRSHLTASPLSRRDTQRLIGGALCSLMVTGPAAAQPMQLTIVSPGPGHPLHAIVSRLLSEALASLGYSPFFRDVPALRAARMVDDSVADAFLFSDLEYQRQHPTQIRVDVPIAHDDIVVFSIHRQFEVRDWSSLKPYSVGYQVGMAIVEAHLQGRIKERSQTAEQVLTKLVAGRSDVVVLPKAIGLLFRRKFPEIVQLPGEPLARVPLYVYLSPQRGELAAPLAGVLRRLRDSGRIVEITRQVEAEL